MTALTYLDANRLGLKLDPTGKVRVIFEPNYDGRCEPYFECITCQDLMEWDPFRSWWYCPSCHYELTPSEADEVLRGARKMLAKLAKSNREKRNSWRFVTWLKQLLGRKVA